MPRKAALQTIPKNKSNNDDVIDDNEFDEEDFIKETKFDNMLSYLKDSPDEYVVSIYKLQERNKRVLVEKMDNELPDPITDLRDKFGGGNFRIMVHNNSGKLIDSADINVAEKEINNNFNQQSSKQDVLNELKAMGELFGSIKGNDSNNEVILKMMEMQQGMTNKLTEMQLASEKRMIDMIEKYNSKKSDLNEFLQIAEAINNIRESGEPSSLPEKLLASPMIQNMAASFMNQQQNIPLPEQHKEKPPLKKITPQEIVNKFVAKLPPGFIDKVTKENAESISKELYEKNQNVIDITTSTMIIETILRNKGLIQ